MQIGAAFLVALVVPAAALVIVTGILRTGAVGFVAFVAWAATVGLLVRALVLRRP